MRPLGGRAAFTTLELMIVLVMAGVVLAGVGSVLRRQQRFFASASVLVEQRSSLRDATGMVPGEIRALSPASGDVVAFSDSSLDIRATIGAGLVCDTLPGRTGIVLVPSSPNGVGVLSSFTTSPQPGDLAFVFDARTTEGERDDTWVGLGVASVSTTTTACNSSPLVAGTVVTTPRMLLRFPPGASLPPTVASGAFVRVLRRVHYRFYRAGSGEWYLGYAEWDGVAFGVVQPVSGPFASYSRRQGSGLQLRYFDESGLELFAPTDAERIARVDIGVRGAARGALAGDRTQLTDSQFVTVRVRNQ